MHPDLSSYVSECWAQVEFCACGKSVFVWSTICVCTRESCRSPNCNTLEHDRLQRDRPPCPASPRPAPLQPPPTVSVIAQQYSATFISLRFHSRMEKFDAHFEDVISFYLFFFNSDVWNSVTRNCLMPGVSVSCSFRWNVRSAIDVGFIMQMKSCGNAKCSILEAWEDFRPQ